MLMNSVYFKLEFCGNMIYIVQIDYGKVCKMDQSDVVWNKLAGAWLKVHQSIAHCIMRLPSLLYSIIFANVLCYSLLVS